MTECDGSVPHTIDPLRTRVYKENSYQAFTKNANRLYSILSVIIFFVLTCVSAAENNQSNNIIYNIHY